MPTLKEAVRLLPLRHGQPTLVRAVHLGYSGWVRYRSSVNINRHVTDDQVCPVRTRCKEAEADQLVKAVRMLLG